MPRIQRLIDADGAVINVGVEIGTIDAADLRSRGLAVPAPFQTTGLIDTGASRTVFHPQVIKYLGLTPRGYADVETAGVAGPVVIKVRLYDVRITLGSYSFPQFPIQAAQVVPATSGVLVIVGRDTLKDCTLFFDGQNKLFSLWF
jgi:predicted aspartyl protease